MAHEEGIPSNDSASIARFDNWATIAAFGIIGVFTGCLALPINHFATVMTTVPEGGIAFTLYVTHVVLFAQLVLLAYLWVRATANELELWITWLSNPQTKAQRDAKGAIFALSIFLGVLLAFSHNVIFTTGFFSLSLLLNYWTQWLANQHFEQAVALTRSMHPGDSRRKKILEVFEHYWFDLPQFGRLVTMMFVSCSAFSLAVAGYGSKTHRPQFEIAAYCVLGLDVLAGEIVIFIWRQKRDGAVEKIAKGKVRTHHA